MLWFVCESLLLVALFLASAYSFFLLPPKYPLNIPAIPFWVVLIPFFKDVDQSDIFKKYIEKPLRTHGAVKLFFGAQWNIVVHRPCYLAEIFKDEDLFQKSGNQKKIPHSVLAAFLGKHTRRLCDGLAKRQRRQCHLQPWKSVERVPVGD